MAAADPKRRMALATWFISEKLARSASVLRELIPPSAKRDVAVSQIEEAAKELHRRPAKAVGDLLGMEGTCAKEYFACWSALPLSWKGAGRHPIPPEWHQVGSRSSAKKRNSNRLATHPVNAMLNYAYAALEGRLRVALIGAGFDLSVGFLHASARSRVPVLLDMLEPCRTMADRVVLGLVRTQSFSPGDFAITADGVVRLHPQLARRVVAGLEADTSLAPVSEEFRRLLRKHVPRNS